MKARVYVTLKKEVLDPQGDAVLRALSSLGLQDVTSVRVGKLIDVELATDSEGAAKETLQKACTGLLANPVIEDADFEFTEEP